MVIPRGREVTVIIGASYPPRKVVFSFWARRIAVAPALDRCAFIGGRASGINPLVGGVVVGS